MSIRTASSFRFITARSPISRMLISADGINRAIRALLITSTSCVSCTKSVCRYPRSSVSWTDRGSSKHRCSRICLILLTAILVVRNERKRVPNASPDEARLHPRMQSPKSTIWRTFRDGIATSRIRRMSQAVGGMVILCSRASRMHPMSSLRSFTSLPQNHFQDSTCARRITAPRTAARPRLVCGRWTLSACEVWPERIHSDYERYCFRGFYAEEPSRLVY